MKTHYKHSPALFAAVVVLVGVTFAGIRIRIHHRQNEIHGLRQVDLSTAVSTNFSDLDNDGRPDERMIAGPGQWKLSVWYDDQWVPVRYLKGYAKDAEGNTIMLSLQPNEAPTNFLFRHGTWQNLDANGMTR